MATSTAEQLDRLLELWDPAQVDAERDLYLRIALHWLAQGWNVVPTKDVPGKEKEPHPKFESLCGPTRQRLTEHQIRLWCAALPGVNGLLLLDSNPRCPMVAIDADSPSTFEWVEQTFGPTPWVTSTGRDGGGRHYMYRVPLGQTIRQANGIIGPDIESRDWAFSVDPQTGKATKAKRWGRSNVDVKSHHNYVVAPGSVHKSGLVYRPLGGLELEHLTEEWILANVPFLDVAVLALVNQLPAWNVRTGRSASILRFQSRVR